MIAERHHAGLPNESVVPTFRDSEGLPARLKRYERHRERDA